MSHPASASAAESNWPRAPWRLILPVGLGYGLLMATQVRLSSSLGGNPIPWGRALALQMPIAAAWVLATPGILRLAHRFPLATRRWPRSVMVHLTASLLFVFLLYLFASWYTPLVLDYAPRGRPLLLVAVRQFVIWVIGDSLIYWSIIAASMAVDHYRRLREREVAAAELREQLVRADLQALQSQLRPHFLFNALHTIGSLIRTGDRDSAVQVTADLGDLLRRMLEGAAHQEVPLKEEIDFIRRYIDVEQARFPDRLQVTFQVEPGALDARVPHLVLQPLVENAIRHGIAPHLFAANLFVGARRHGSRLQLVVRDDGPGMGNGDGSRPGIGLSNTRARLNHLYGGDFQLEVANLPEGGVESRVEIPYHLAAAEWEASP